MTGNGLGHPQTAQPTGRLLKIGELSRRTGLTRQALHQYVLLGLLTPVGLTKGGQRLFEDNASERVKLVRDLCGQGYTLGEIREIFFRQRPAGTSAR